MASDGMPAQHRGGPWWVVGTEALEVRTGERQRAGVLGKLEPHQRLLQVHPCFAAFATPQLDVGQRHQIMAQRMRPPAERSRSTARRMQASAASSSDRARWSMAMAWTTRACRARSPC